MKFRYSPLVIIISVICFAGCWSKNNFPVDKVNCGNAERINSLVQYILDEKNIYYDFDKSISNYLITQEVIKSGKTYYGYDSMKIKSTSVDSIRQKNVNRIVFHDWKFNEDTTSIEVEVNFYAYGKYEEDSFIEETGPEKFKKRSSFYFVFDVQRCKWILRDSRFSFYEGN